MIPRTVRYSIWANKALPRKLPKRQSFMLSKLYSTERNDIQDNQIKPDQTSNAEEPKEERELEIWELKPTKSKVDGPQTLNQSARDRKEFLDILEKLDGINTNKAKRSAVKPSSSNFDEGVQAQIIIGLIQGRKSNAIFKQKKPLPRSAIDSLYGKVAGKLVPDELHPKDPQESDLLFDFLEGREEQKYNWDQTVVSENQQIALKQAEMETIRAIVEASTALDLWHCVEREINRDDYPKYYPNVLTKAIEHASDIDPYIALTIFEKAKQKSIQSYISGCTVKVYNAMLLLRWEVWRDVNGMLDLAEEMTLNGIEFNSNSRKIVRAVVQEIESEGGDLGDGTDNSENGVFWNAEEKRNCNLMKELAGKWLVSE